MAWISAPICLVIGRTSSCTALGVLVDTDSCVASDTSDLPCFCYLLGCDESRRRRRCMGEFTARQRRQDPIDQSAGRPGAELNRDAGAPALAFIGEVDGEHVVEGRVIGMVEIDVGGVDLHPALAALGAADEIGFFDDVGAHGEFPPYSAAMLEAAPAR